MIGIEARQIGHALEIGRLVDRYHLHALAQRRFMQRPQQAAADAAEAVDGKT